MNPSAVPIVHGHGGSVPETREIQPMREHVFASGKELITALACHIALLAEHAICTRGNFAVVLTGGRSVQALYEALKGIDTHWAAWTVYWSDERCLPTDHPDRNSRQAIEVWLSRVPIPAANIHPIPAEKGARQGAGEYARTLAGVGAFDLVLLSLGEDGHVASIFPGMDKAGEPVVAVEDAPKWPTARVSLGLPRLAQTRELVLLAMGHGKRAALAACRGGLPSPTSELRHLAALDIWLDQAADSHIPSALRAAPPAE